MDNAKQSKRWAFSTGERGTNRVRAFEHQTTGRLFLMYYEPTPPGERARRRSVALAHTDRNRAKAQAEELAAKLRLGAPTPTAELTLQTLFDNYLREVTPGKSRSEGAHDRRASAIFLRAFGASTEARLLSRREWDRFIRDRRSGRLAPADRKRPNGVRDRAIEHDLQFLRAALNWATRISTGRGGVLLERNPLRGLTLPKELNPRRPVLSEAEYAKMLRVGDQCTHSSPWRWFSPTRQATESGRSGTCGGAMSI